MVTKNESIVPPLESAMTPSTIIRLNLDNTNFDNGLEAVRIAKAAKITAGEAAIVSRDKLDSIIKSFYKGINSAIDQGDMPNSARAYYGLSISNKQLPVVDTDERRLYWIKQTISGDAARVLAGGIAMTNPTIATFTTVSSAAKLVITAYSTSKTAVTTAQTAVNGQRTEVDGLILQGWNEIETKFSGLDAAAKRAMCREYGIKYVSKGLPAVVTGIITNSLTGLPLEKVKVRISGSGKKVLTNALGQFTINTNLYGDLELLTSLTDYEDGVTDFIMANGVDMAVNAVMVHD